MKEDLAARLETIEWSAYETAYGPATNVSEQLDRLLRGREDAALQAAHDLWCGLCHGHAYVSNAALPAFPFLMEALGTRSDAVKVEVMDMLAGFVECSSAKHPDGKVLWVRELRRLVSDAVARFRELEDSSNEDVRDWAAHILESLGFQRGCGK